MSKYEYRKPIIDKFMARRRSGMTGQQAVEGLGVTLKTLQFWAHRAGISLRVRPFINDKVLADFQTLRTRGVTCKEAAESLGFKYGSIRSYAQMIEQPEMLKPLGD